MPNQEMIGAVVAASDGPLVANKQLEKLRDQVLEQNRDLIDHGRLYPDGTELRGDRCLVVDVHDVVVSLVAHRLSQIAADMGLVVVFELGDLVLAYGDDTPDMFIRTYNWDIAWASPRALSQWLTSVTNEMIYFHDHGREDVDFLIVGETHDGDQYIQTMYQPAEGGVPSGSPRRWPRRPLPGNDRQLRRDPCSLRDVDGHARTPTAG